MDWYSKLEEWGYPRVYELAPILTDLGLDPEKYVHPLELARDLKAIVIPLEWWDPIKWFFEWLWGMISPWAVDIGLILLGGLISWVTTGWYRAIGIIPIGIALYRILKRTGVIG